MLGLYSSTHSWNTGRDQYSFSTEAIGCPATIPKGTLGRAVDSEALFPLFEPDAESDVTSV